MALYDIINEISGREVTKTQTGDERIWGVMLGVVAKNYDKDMPGRVCVTIPSRDKDANTLQWARIVQPSGGKEWGHYFLPEVGDQVLLVFEGGHIEKPYIIGCVQMDKNKFLTKSVDEQNQFKRIVTKHGSTIKFEDNKDDEKGAKDKITIATAAETLNLLMDNENKLIKISEVNKENEITLKTEKGKGTMEVKVKSKLTIKVGDNITVTMNGESGGVTIDAKDIKLNAQSQLTAHAETKVGIDSNQVSVSGSGSLKLSSNGSLTGEGSPVKMG